MKRILITAYAIVLCFTARAYDFVTFNTVNSGISYDGVTQVLQDSRGFLWVGTYKGLNRFDGKHWKTYYRDDLGLKSDMIHVLTEAPDGDLWVGTDYGACRYCYDRDCFISAGTSISNKVTCISADPDGTTWMLVNKQGIYSFTESEGLKMIVNYSDFSPSIAFCYRKMVHCSDGSFLLSRYHLNLYSADADLRNFAIVDLGESKDFFKGDDIGGLFQGEEEGLVYVVSSKRGVCQVNLKRKQVKQLYTLPQTADLQHVFRQTDGTFLLSTTEGVWRYDGHTDEKIYEGFSNCCHVDLRGGIWVGTKDNGLKYCAPDNGIFKSFDKTTDNTSLEGCICGQMSPDSDGNVWIATEKFGILLYSPKYDTISRVKVPGIMSTVCSLCPDGDILWVGTLQGLYRYDIKAGTTRDYGVLTRKSGINDPRTYRIFKTSSGDLLASTTIGIFRYNSAEDRFEDLEYFEGAFVTDFMEDKACRLWITTYATGVYVWDYLSGDSPVQYSEGDSSLLPINKIVSAASDEKGRVWIFGFNYGLSVYNEGTHSFGNYNRENTPALPTNVFFSAERAGKHLWISSDAGLLRLEPETMEINVFGRKDGLLDTKFTNSSCSTSDGRLLFGSDNGIICFNPAEMTTSEEAPSVTITEFRINDEVRRFDRNINLENDLTLNYKQRTISFSFSVDEISSARSTRLQSMLEGYQSAWQDISVSRTAAYYNLPPGKYSLRLRSSYVCGEWAECHAPITIRIRPPFLASLPGLVCIALAFSLIVLMVQRQSLSRERRKRAKEEEGLRKVRENAAFQEKLNFFSHVIHEIKTPLTLIKTPLGNIRSKNVDDPETKHDLDVMSSSAEYMSKLVNEMLDFVRVERSGYVMHPEKINLVDKLHALLFDFNDTARNNNLRLAFHTDLPSAFVNADMGALDKILNNLLINAIKYAETYIDVSLGVGQGSVTIRCTNDGPLVPLEMREDIFKPFLQYRTESSNNVSGVGLGLSLSRSLAHMLSGTLTYEEADSANCFVLTLPLIAESPVNESNREDILPEDSDLQTVLVADDNVELRSYIATKLSDKYKVVQARDGLEALKSIHHQNISLVVTDISMPGMNGLELCRAVREDTEISHIPVIIVSARSSVQSKIEAMEAGADIFVEKPFDLEYLKSSISNILGRRTLMQSVANSGLLTQGNLDKFGLPKKDEEFLEKFNSLIRDNLQNEALSVEWLAGQLAMSSSTLTRKLRRLLDISPNNYISSLRLSVAAQMLSGPHGNNVSDICYAVGFSNLSYFSKCFKERYGVTPTSYSGRNR